MHPVVYEYAKKVQIYCFKMVKNCGKNKKVMYNARINAPTVPSARFQSDLHLIFIVYLFDLHLSFFIVRSTYFGLSLAGKSPLGKTEDF
jgi:hypothetical protein